MDVLGVAYGLEVLDVERVTASALPWFSGQVQSPLGPVPLPAPAVAFLLRGKPVFATEAQEELISPVGAALVHALADQFAAGPDGVVTACGTGYGSRPEGACLRIDRAARRRARRKQARKPAAPEGTAAHDCRGH